MALSNKSSVLAIVKETSEAVPSFPTSGASFVALQDGFSMEPAFNELENREMKASIGKSQTLLGLEQPKSSFDHYLRHSGVEGQAPNYKLLLESVFGIERINATQYPTIAGSTVKVLKVASGIGANFRRGQALLVKNAANGFEIRPIHSITTDDLTLGFDLKAAPAAAVNLGKAVQYAPANEGHPTLSILNYRANGGALEMMTGARVTEMSIDFAAGEYINAKYSLDGVEYFYNPMKVDANNNKLDFKDMAITRLATIPQKTYKDPIDLASAIEAAMNGLGSANTFTVTYSSTTGKYKFSSSGATFELLWNTGASVATSIGLLIGADMAANQIGATNYVLVNAIDLKAKYSPLYDNAKPLVAKNNEVYMGSSESLDMIKASKVSLRIGNSRKEIQDVTAVSGVSGSTITARDGSISFTSILDKYDAEKFARFRKGDETRFLYNFGTKSGGNWEAGKCGCIYIPTATITNFKLSDDDGLITLEVELKPFVDSEGNGEIYLNFL